MSIPVQFVPLKDWPGQLRDAYTRVNGNFRTSLARAQDDLIHEGTKMGARGLIIFAAVKREQLRRDGSLHSSATFIHPGVIVEIDMGPGKPPRRFVTDYYSHAHKNIRAIALTLEFLRKSGQHGVIQRDEQYRGFEALPPGQSEARNDAPAFAGIVEAADFLLKTAGSSESNHILLNDPEVLTAIFRRAIKQVHPDYAVQNGGRVSVEETERVIAAKDMIEAAQKR